MLAYKAWRESRGRFLLSAAAIAWFAGLFVVMRPWIQYAARRPFDIVVIDTIYAGGVRNIFILLIIAFGMGGLAQERSRGVVSFTLALPVRRARMVATRGAVGLLQVVAVALIPTVAVLGWARVVGERFGVADALQYSLQWAAAGSVLFGVAFLMSVWVAGPYAALTATLLTVATYVSILNVAALRAVPALNVFALMERSHPSAARLVAAFAVALLCIAVAAVVTERQDF